MKPYLPLLAVLLFVGCQCDPAPTPDDTCVADDTTPEPQPATEAEFTAAKFEVLTRRLDDAESRLLKIETEPKSCPLPEVAKSDIRSLQQQIDDLKSAQVRLSPKLSESPKSAVDAAIEKAQSAGHKLLIVFRQTKCVWCDRFESNVLNDSAFASAIFKDYDLLRVNTDNDADSGKRFKITSTPTIVVYDAEGTDYHRIQPPMTVDGTLAALGIQSGRRRLFNR